jgi:glycosyltransferase involved in cell wall biosynthesis
VPVVATTGGATPEICGDAALLVAPGDADALADAVRRVLDDEALRARLVEAGGRRADAFPKETTARALLRVLEGACARGPR